MKIGIMPSGFRIPLEDAIRKAAECGAAGVQINVKQPDVLMCDWSDDAVADVARWCRESNLEVSAVCGDVGGHDFQLDGKNMERAEQYCRTVDLAVKLNTKVVTSHIGTVPEDPADPTRLNMVNSIRKIAEYARSKGVVMAIETGPESPETLLDFIEQVNVPGGLGVNLDPANLRMVGSFCPVHAVKLLGKYIVHTHAKDGVNYKPGPAYARYGIFNPDGSQRVFEGVPVPDYKEVPLGQGQVPWDEYLAALRDAGYDGYLTIERECGDDPEADIRMAVGFLQTKI